MRRKFLATKKGRLTILLAPLFIMLVALVVIALAHPSPWATEQGESAPTGNFLVDLARLITFALAVLLIIAGAVVAVTLFVLVTEFLFNKSPEWRYPEDRWTLRDRHPKYDHFVSHKMIPAMQDFGRLISWPYRSVAGWVNRGK